MKYLTKQEELLLLTIFNIKSDAYLINIREQLIEQAGKDWPFGSIYTSLERLKNKGYIQTRKGVPSSNRGGKAVKFYELTNEGIEILNKTKILQDKMWRNFSNVALEKGFK